MNTSPRPGGTSRSAAYALIAGVEDRHDLLRHTIGGWSAWPILRKAVADGLTGEFLVAATKTSRLRPLWGVAARDFANLVRLRRARLLVKTYVSGLLDDTGDGHFRDIWFDDVLERRRDAVKIEGINNRQLLSRRGMAARPSAATTTLLDLASRALPRVWTSDPEVQIAARELGAVIQLEFAGVVPTHAVLAVLSNFAWQRRLYSILLSRIKPEAVVIIDFGEYALVAAAKSRGIRVLALQHGITDRIHATYAWTDYASSRRSQLPIPDLFLLHGEHWREELSVSHFWGEDLKVVGSPRIDRYRAVPRTSGQGPYRILFTADGIDATETIKLIADFLTVADGLDVAVIIKLHPVYTALDDEIRAAFSNEMRVSVRSAQDGDSTFLLLRGVDLHVSIASASHYDALGLGTPTAILGVGNYQPVEHLHHRGHAALIRNGSELRHVLEKARGSVVPEAVSRFYFKPGAVESILAVIDGSD